MPAIPSSSAPAARKWLFDQCTAALTPDPDSPNSSLLVCYDEPGTYQPDDMVSIGKVLRQIEVNSLVGGGGAGWLQERYTVTVDIEVFRGGDYPDVVFNRTSALVDGVVAVGRLDPSLGDTVLIATPTQSEIEVLWTEDHQGRIGTATVDISCFQRI